MQQAGQVGYIVSWGLQAPPDAENGMTMGWPGVGASACRRHLLAGI